MLDFIGIGARRGGEIWLYNQLRRHPEIHFPRNLELGFWSKHYLPSLEDENYPKNLDWYRTVFRQWSDDGSDAPEAGAQKPSPYIYKRTWFENLMAKLDGMGPAPARTHDAHGDALEIAVKRPRYKQGDFSPSYCCFDDARILPAIHDFAPDAKILFILRHPFERAWASAQKAVLDAGMQPEEASDAFYTDHLHSALSRTYGSYICAIESWQSVYGKERLLLLQFEDIATNPKTLLKTCCKHIGVEQTDYFDAMPDEAIAWEGMAVDLTRIRPSLLPVLEELYAEEITKLKRDYGIDYENRP